MTTGTNERALHLLGQGIQAETVASALGVSPSYISQLLSDEDFRTKVTQLKFETLSAHTQRDASYDEVEDSLVEKLKKSIPLIIRPQDILGAIKVINGAKRRGVDSSDSLITQQNIVQLNMPVQIVQEFTTNLNNQVVQAGEQSLQTMQSGDLRKKAEESMTPAPALEMEEIQEESNEVLASLS